jgi:hypothetical protein
VIDEILNFLGHTRDGTLQVYWCFPGKDITDGLVLVNNDSQCIEMIKASKTHKTLVLFVDHTNFLRELRDDVIIKGCSALPPVTSPRKVAKPSASVEGGPSSSAVGAVADKGKSPEIVSELVESDDSDSDTEFYDSDYDVEEGDDDLFADNVDTCLNDYNEKVICDENEDDAALDDEDLNLKDEDKKHLKHKFKSFNPEVDMDNPTFKVGMAFSDVEEVRQALAAYTIRNRVPIKKVKNDRKRLIAICAEGCPWLLKS